jgi:hypothetical protein
MGFFSWKCAQCDESVMNNVGFSTEDSDCVLVTPHKNYHEHAYRGYGKFAGTDVYTLLGGGDRNKGVTMDCGWNPDDLPFRIKVVHTRCHSPYKCYEDYKPSESCPVQGYYL